MGGRFFIYGKDDEDGQIDRRRTGQYEMGILQLSLFIGISSPAFHQFYKKQ